MRTASAQALRSGHAALDTSLAGEDSAERVAEELFALADIFTKQSSLRRALTDPARHSEEKQALVAKVLSAKVAKPTLTVAQALVAQRWSSDRDLVKSLQQLGCLALIDVAGRNGQLEQMQHELGHIRNLLRESRDLRIALSPASQYETSQRIALVARVLENKVSASTIRLVQRVIEYPHGASLISALDALASEVAHAREKRLVRVTAAAPLSSEQLERLHRILSKKYGSVTINTAVNPDFIGGMRVRVGSDAIDGTLQARIAGVKQRLGA